MRRIVSIAVVSAIGFAMIGCGSSQQQDDGLKLSKTPPPIDQPASGAKPPEMNSPKGGNGEGS